MRDVVGIGNAIVDVLGHADDEFLTRHGLFKGAMTLVGAERALELLRGVCPALRRSGGSAANTAVGVASLGGRSAYVGKVREDELGRLFRDDLRASGVDFDVVAAADGPATACCLVLVTPDAQRTMQTFLGASATLGPDDIDPGLIESARITYLEGYLWDPPAAKEAFLRAAAIAHEGGRSVALSLSDRFCVERHREEFRHLLQEHVDVVLANEDEFRALFEVDDTEQATRMLEGRCRLAAVTRGAAGSLVAMPGSTVEVPAEPVERVVDTTGAGDLFAAGFLLGLARGADPVASARMGSLAAAEVIGHFGARPDVDLARWVERRGGWRP